MVGDLGSLIVIVESFGDQKGYFPRMPAHFLTIILFVNYHV